MFCFNFKKIGARSLGPGSEADGWRVVGKPKSRIARNDHNNNGILKFFLF